MRRKISKRRLAAIIISSSMIVFIAVAAFANPEDGDTLILAFLGMLFLGVFQLLSAIAGMIRGSKAQGIYLLASIIYLAYYSACVVGYVSVPNFGMDETYLGVLVSLVFATIYTLILIFDMAPAKIIIQPQDDLLDDWK